MFKTKVHIICQARWEISFEFVFLRNYFEAFVYYFIFWLSRGAGSWTGYERWWWVRWFFLFFSPWPWLLSSLFVPALYCVSVWVWWRGIYFSFPCLVSFNLLTCRESLWVFWYLFCWLIIFVILSFINFLPCLITGVTFRGNNIRIMLVCMQRLSIFKILLCYLLHCQCHKMVKLTQTIRWLIIYLAVCLL